MPDGSSRRAHDASPMTHPSPDTPSVVERTRPVAADAAVVGVHFLGDTRGLRARRGGAAAGAAQGERAARRGPWRRASWLRPPTARASSPAATTARWWRPTRAAPAPLIATDAKHRWIDHVAIGPSRRGGLVGRQAGVRARRQGRRAQLAKCPRRSAGWRSRRRAFGWRSRTTTAPRSGFPNAPRRRPRRSTGRARISASPSVPTDASWSPSMQEPTLHGWRSPTARTCACRATRARVQLARLDRRRQMARDARARPAHPVAVPGQGRSDGQDAADSGADARRRSRSSPATRSETIVAVGYADGLVLLVRTRRRRRNPGASKPADAPVTALAWSADGKASGLRDRRRRGRHCRSALTSRGAPSSWRAGTCFADGFCFGAGRRAGPGASMALSGRRFQVWVRPNNAIPR